MPAHLTAAIEVDYQNVHLVGHKAFGSTRLIRPHETLVDPLLFARQLLLTRSAAQRAAEPLTILQRVCQRT